MSFAENKKLEYEIWKFTSFSSSYVPENIREDQPDNQASRWSSDSNTQIPQYLILKLHRPAIVRKIYFGKYEKQHVCNLRKFKIYGGTEESCKVLLLEAGLKNDSQPESFDLKHHTSSGELLPIRYIQILPLFSWGTGFNFSIWYVEVLGMDDPVYISSVLKNYNVEREVEIVRLCLKYFRQQGYDAAFTALQNQTKIRFEHPIPAELYQTLVVEGDFRRSEAQIEKLVEDGLMDEYIDNQPYNVEWTQIETDSLRPGKRGGHQLIMDTKNRLMYLYGGWNGVEDLSDMWSFDLRSRQWNLIHKKSENTGGPSPRACHKMVLDTHTSQIFMLGRYIEPKSRDRDLQKSDFYLYDTITKTWLLICDNTADVGGPQLLYDHQMCIDSDKRRIYVFGGRVLTPNSDDINAEQIYSGLYVYDISDNVWNLLLVDTTTSDPSARVIKSRITHCMLFHDKKRKLYIFGGQREKQYMTDFVTYDVDSDTLTTLEHSGHDNSNARNIPQPGLTLRATIDAEKDEIYVLPGLSKEKERRETHLNAFWMYSLKKDIWNCIYRGDETEISKQMTCPCPRYAHQLVFDPVEGVHYLFGGNPGIQFKSQERLDDFWSLHLRKSLNRDRVLQQCRYLIRTQEYETLTRTDPILGLQYLQTELYQVIDHSDEEQLKHFHKLATLLFKTDPNTPTSSQAMSPDTPMEKSPAEVMEENSQASSLATVDEDDLYHSNIERLSVLAMERNKDEQQCSRYMLYNNLIEFLPEKMSNFRYLLEIAFGGYLLAEQSSFSGMKAASSYPV